MKKAVLSLFLIVIIISSLSVPVAAKTNTEDFPTDGIIAHYKLDGDLVNSVTGIPAAPMGREFTEAYYDLQEKNWFCGVDGYAYYGNDGDGFSTELNPGNGDFSVAFWVSEPFVNGITPYMWYGIRDQWDSATNKFGGECWLTVWNVSVKNGWAMEGVTVGSNDPAGARIEIVPETAAKFTSGSPEFLLQWTHIAISAILDKETNTYTIKMYCNGEFVGENVGFPNPYAEDAYIYFNGINAWVDSPSSGLLDDIVIYEKALTSKEIHRLYGCYDTSAPKIYADTDDMFSDKVNYAFILENPNSTVIDYSKKEEAPRTGLSTLPLAILTAISGIYIAKKKK